MIIILDSRSFKHDLFLVVLRLKVSNRFRHIIVAVLRLNFGLKYQFQTYCGMMCPCPTLARVSISFTLRASSNFWGKHIISAVLRLSFLHCILFNALVPYRTCAIMHCFALVHIQFQTNMGLFYVHSSNCSGLSSNFISSLGDVCVDNDF
jgi:hypothetical protein